MTINQRALYVILLLIVFLAMLAGCADMPKIDGTYSQKPVSDKFILVVHLGEDKVLAQCPVNALACAKTVEMNGKVIANIYMPELASPHDIWWAGLFLHEAWHPVFGWRHGTL